MIVWCAGLTLIVTTATTVTAVLSLQLHFAGREGRPVPDWLHTAAVSYYVECSSLMRLSGSPHNSQLSSHTLTLGQSYNVIN